MSLKAIIIDDEPFVRNDLAHLLLSCNGVEVTSEAANLTEARDALRAAKFDLVFLDVHLPGGTGFDLLPYIDSSSRIVFVTGHDEYAVRAFEINALDYLLKPVSKERLARTLARVKLPEPDQGASKILVKTDTGHLSLSPSAIVSIVSVGGNYVRVDLANRAPVLCRKTVKACQSELCSDAFLRIHRSILVNTRHITKVDRSCEGQFKVHLGNGRMFAASRRMTGRLKQWLVRQGAL